jgi:hypothetical protein
MRATYANAGNLGTEIELNPRLVFHQTANFGVKQGPKQFTPTIIPTNSYQETGGQVQFLVTPPSPATAVDPQMYIKWYIEVSAVASVSDNNGYALSIGRYDAPRYMPMSQCMVTTSLSINDNNAQMTLDTMVNPLSRCNLNNYDTSIQQSQAPSALDEYQNYNDAYSGGYQFPATAISGGLISASALGGAPICDPLTSYGGTLGKYSAPRGAWPIQIVSRSPQWGVGGAVGNRTQGQPFLETIRFIVLEPLWISPLDSVYTDANGCLIGLNNFNININLDFSKTRCWSHNALNSNASTLTSLTMRIYSNPELHVNYLTLPDSIPQPLVATFPFYLPQTYQTPAKDRLVYNQTTLTSTQTITLQSIPSRILLWATIDKNLWDYTTSDTFAQIMSVQILYDNQSAILSQASSEDLYMESVQNGLQMSWIQWSQTVGSILIVDVTKNLPLTNLEEAPGLCCTKQIQVIMTIRDINTAHTAQAYPNGVPFTIWMATISSGVMSIENGSTSLQSAILSRTGIMEAVTNPRRVLNEVSVTPYGGAMAGGGKIRKWIEKANNNVQKLLQQPKAMTDMYQNQMQQQQHSERPYEQGYRMNPALAVGDYRGGGYGGAFIDKNTLKRKAASSNIGAYNFSKDAHRFEEIDEDQDF